MVSVRLTRSRLWALLVVFVTIGFVATFGTAVAHPFLNSAEPGCDGSDPNVLMCDDFEDGVWYATNCDVAGHPTPSNPDPSPINDGWCGSIFAEPITPPNAAICGTAGAVGTNCAAHGGTHAGNIGAVNVADHAFVGFVGVDEIYVRWYYKADAGYVWGAEKSLTFNDGLPGDGGIKWGDFSFNCASSASSTGNPTMGFPVPQDQCIDINPNDDISIESGRWYFFEIHMKLSTPVQQPDGVFEMWINDCGTNGLQCTGTPTLRLLRTNIKYDRQSSGELIRVLWWSNWANPPSVGTNYIDQIKVSKVGPVGFMGTSSVAPAAPSNLSVR